ncbi:transposase, partial [[Clostridium] saccharogumia]|uniref:transposase n=1 Tax=Thomasclavelia saccharogumia TaxID=341225 RepID=UPI001D093B1F
LKNNFSISLSMGWYIKYKYPDNIIIIKRNEILKYITTKNEKTKKNKTVEKNIQIIKERYPIITELEKIYDSFYSTIKEADTDQLDKFIDNYRESVLKGFIEGIEKDIAPIKNAISYPYSSGFVEGNNNKFKLIKRILYERSKIVNLFRKCYIPFLMNNKDFKLIDILEHKNSTISCAV